MKKLKKLLLNRIAFVALAIIVQFAFFFYFLMLAIEKNGWNNFFSILSIIIILIILLSDEQKAAYKMVWVFLIAILPLFGGILYLFLGDKKFSKRRRGKIENQMVRLVGQVLESEEARYALNSCNPLLSRQSNIIRNLSRYGVWVHTKSSYFVNGEDFLSDVLSELEKAEKFIFIEYFIISLGSAWYSILEVLKRKVKSGVDVRILYDDLGSAVSVPFNYFKTLSSYGIKAHPFNPVKLHINPRLNFRDHRKILNIDGNICYTGGLNLADEYMNREIRYGYWKDNAIKLEGDAVWNLTVIFLENWAFVTGDLPDDFSIYKPTIHPETDGFVQPFSDTPLDYKNVTESAYMEILNHAKKYVWITTPYLILDDEMTNTLIRVALCGVDVRIITPYVPDKKLVHEVTRSSYERLMAAGAKIYEFSPGFIHSKTFVSDDEVAFVGTANLDNRSLYLHFELSVAFYDSTIIEVVKSDFLDAMALSKLQQMNEVRNVAFGRRILRKFLKIFSPAL